MFEEIHIFYALYLEIAFSYLIVAGQLLSQFNFDCNTRFDWIKLRLIYVAYVTIRLTLKTYQSARRYIQILYIVKSF